MADVAVRSAAVATYRDLCADGHEVDCFLVADPCGVDGFGDEARTRLCIVDPGFRAVRWSDRPPVLARAVERVAVRIAAIRLRGLVVRAGRRVKYDAFVRPRWRS